MKSEWCLRWSS